MNHPVLPLKSLILRVFMRITHREEVTGIVNGEGWLSRPANFTEI